MNKTSVLIVWVLFFFVICNQCFAEKRYEWKKQKEKEGILVTTRKVEGSKFKMYKARSIINQPMEVLFEVLLDVPGYAGWMPDVQKAHIITMLDQDRIKGNLVLRVEFDSIWPVKNRDVVIKVLSAIDWDKGHVVITLTDTNDYNVPLKSGLKRVDDFYAVFDFQYIDREHTHVTFTTHADPGGAVPAGLVQIQTGGIPYKTLKQLAKVAENPEYYKQAMKDYF